MAPSDSPESDVSLPEDEQAVDQSAEGGGEGEAEEPKQKLNLQVNVEERSTCERHITVTIPREDITRYFDEQYSELRTTAQLPGFRVGHAPRKLVEKRFRKDVASQVKSKLLTDSIAQVGDDQDLTPISEPVFNIEAIEVPEEGPMVYEFDLEVRPVFDLPQWKGLKVDKPVREFNDQDVDVALKNLLTRYGSLVPHDGSAEVGDYITTNLTFFYNGQELSSAKEEVIRIRPVLSFRDGKITDFATLMTGVRNGETREGVAEISDDAPNVSLRGQKVTARFEVLEVKKLQLPELTPEFLLDMGGFESVADLRDAVLDNLNLRLEYHQRRVARQQITDQLTRDANWQLPPAMLERQSARELSRAVMELRRSGFSDKEIQAYQNELRQNSQESTARALKEHFILERIAEEESIEAAPEDYDEEIALIAEQSGETARRVRAKLEKSGGMDVLHNQVIERLVVDEILEHAEFREVPYQPEQTEAEAVDRAAAGGEAESEIPEAKAQEEEKSAEEKPAEAAQDEQSQPAE
jgi:trigger factor